MDLEASNIVKPVRVLLSLLMVAAVLFASASSVSAIGFDAEKHMNQFLLSTRELPLEAGLP